MWATTQSPIDPSLDLRYARNSPLSPRSNLLRSNSVHQAQAARAMIPGPSDSLYQTMPTQLLGSSEANPLVRFYNDPGPWNSQRIEASAPAPMGSRNSTWDEHMSQPNGSFQQYRDPARSEVESSVTGRQLSDSGYGRSYATKSALSADPVDQNQECRSVTSQIGYMQMYPEQSPRDYMADDTQNSQPPAFGIQDDGPEPQSSALQSLRCNWDGCDTTSKNQSEHRCAHVVCFKGAHTDFRAPLENTSFVTKSPTDVKLQTARGPKASVQRMIWTGTERANTSLSQPPVLIEAFAAQHSIVPKRRKSGRASIISVNTANGCMAKRASRTLSRSQWYPRIQMDTCSIDERADPSWSRDACQDPMPVKVTMVRAPDH